MQTESTNSRVRPQPMGAVGHALFHGAVQASRMQARALRADALAQEHARRLREQETQIEAVQDPAALYELRRQFSRENRLRLSQIARLEEGL